MLAAWRFRPLNSHSPTAWSGIQICGFEFECITG
jgi:hypothetical protein